MCDGAGIAQSVQRLASSWTVRGSNPGGWRFSAPVHTNTWAHPASYTIGIGSFPGVKRPERDLDSPLPSSAEVKEWVELYFYSPSGPSRPVLGWTLPLQIQHVWQHNTIKHDTTQHNTTQQYDTIQYNTTQRNTTKHNITKTANKSCPIF